MTRLALHRRILARPSIVFAAMTSAEGIAAWWGPDELPVSFAEVDARVGGAFRVRFPTTDGLEHEARGEYLVVDPPRRLVMSWRWTSGGEPGELGRTSRIEIELTPVAGGVELSLMHGDLVSATSELHHWQGWSGSLDKLVRHLATETASVDAIAGDGNDDGRKT
jgi:uncharacterized protein YndB with AHSA1/START domain